MVKEKYFGINLRIKLIMKKNKKNKKIKQIVKIKKKKYYLILSKKDKFQYGVFPYTKEGLSSAKSYLNKITTKPELYMIKPK